MGSGEGGASSGARHHPCTTIDGRTVDTCLAVHATPRPCASVPVCVWPLLGWVTHNCSRAAAAVERGLLEALCHVCLGHSGDGSGRHCSRHLIVLCGVCLVPSCMQHSIVCCPGLLYMALNVNLCCQFGSLTVTSSRRLWLVMHVVWCHCWVSAALFLSAGHQRLPGMGLTCKL